MVQNRPIIFVSHAAVDKAIAAKFKSDVEQNFLGLCELFVSSSLDSINPGDDWVRKVLENLKKTCILVGLLSPVALTRGWVYFEFGAAAIRGIPVIPICHSGLRREMLPPPISLFQGIEIVEQADVEGLYARIAAALNCQVPAIDYNKLTAEYFDITEVTRIGSLLTNWTKQLLEWNPELSKLLDKTLEEVQVLIPAHLEMPFNEYRQVVTQRKMLEIEAAGFGMGTRVGAQASIFKVRRGTSFDDLLNLTSQRSS